MSGIPIKFIRVLDPTNGDENPTVRMKKRRMSISPGPVDAHAVVILVVRTAKGLGPVGWSAPLLRRGGR